MKAFDVAIIGAGQAGPALAKALAEAGRNVALIERKHAGGSCINFGCTPTKAALASARVAHLARRAHEFGIGISNVHPDFAAVIARAAGIAETKRKSLQESFTGNDNLEWIAGHARFLGPDGDRFRLAVGNEEILASQVVLDTGTRSAVPSIDGLSGIDYLDAENWLDHRALPHHLAIVGGGYIGLEMAQFYRRMGAEVTVIESGPQVVSKEDADVAGALQGLLAREGIRFRLGSKAQRFRKDGQHVSVTLDSGGNTEDLTVSDVFIALGRKPNTDDLGLESVGLFPTEKGTLETDQWRRTGRQGIWAVGDIRGGAMFTHTAWDDYRTVASQLLDGQPRAAQKIVPYAIFTDPELGRVGMTETAARDSGKRIEVGRFNMKNNGKAVELGETDGFIKVVIDAESKRILGAAVLSTEAAELVHVYAALMSADAPYTVLDDAIQIHPTLSEALQSAVSSLA
jgi:pyruvate/2-oxoglutarate dehydrogenase complex dihydrolipoamide dehydrogenase (E3) component